MAAFELNRLFNQVEQLIRAGEWKSAEQVVGQLVEVAPNLPGTWAYSGAVHLYAGRVPEAEQSFRNATALNPRDAVSWHHLSMTLYSQNRFDEAEDFARRAVAIDGSHASFLLQLGNVLFARERFGDAVEALQQSVAADPLNPTAWNNLAAAHHVQKNWTRAKEAYDASLALQPDQLETRLKLINLMERSLSFSAAERMAEPLTVDYPNCANAWSLLGAIQLRLAKQPEAIRAMRHAAEIEPSPQRRSRVLQTLQYEEHADPGALLAEHQAWDRAYAAELLPPSRAISFGSRLRIGFVSSDLGLNPVAHAVLPLLEAIDKRRCSLTCYFDNKEQDHITPQFQSATDQWRVTYRMSDQALTEQIRADNIDVLVDLMGHTGNRLLVLARKPAPVQITWFGYVGTTGMKAMDYLLADSFHVRPGEEHNYVETVLRMPHGYACYGPPDYAPEVVDLPALSKRHVTFGSFNNPAKWTPLILDAWAEILRRIPESRLLLKFGGLHEPQTQDLFRLQFHERGIESDRICLEGWLEHRDLLDAYNRIDIALDTQPYSGGVTTCEALWMGIPVITWPGKTFAGRHATSHLMNAGFEQFVARDLNEYVNMSIDWASRLDELAVIRSKMRDRMRQSPLCDAPRFASDFLAVLTAAISRSQHH
jgi:protein O-GlcNAc transferase